MRIRNILAGAMFAFALSSPVFAESIYVDSLDTDTVYVGSGTAESGTLEMTYPADITYEYELDGGHIYIECRAAEPAGAECKTEDGSRLATVTFDSSLFSLVGSSGTYTIPLPSFVGAAQAQEVVPAPLPDTTVSTGPLYALFLEYVLPILGTLLPALATWAVWKVTGIRLEAEARTAIETFATNAAGDFLRRFESVAVRDIDVKNALIAELARGALTRIPDALARFNWTPEQVAQRIVEKIGVLTAPTPAPVVVAEAVASGMPPAKDA